MAINSRYLFVVNMDVDADKEALFNEIYDTEHIPNLLKVPGVRGVSCWQCHREAVLSADRWPDHMAVPTLGPRMVCTRCGIIGADARPNWREQPARESLTGVQWR
jgi:hypothetical protein